MGAISNESLMYFMPRLAPENGSVNISTFGQCTFFWNILKRKQDFLIGMEGIRKAYLQYKAFFKQTHTISHAILDQQNIAILCVLIHNTGLCISNISFTNVFLSCLYYFYVHVFSDYVQLFSNVIQLKMHSLPIIRHTCSMPIGCMYNLPMK